MKLAAEVERGATIGAVAARNGVSGSALGYWRRRLRAENLAMPVLLPVSVAGAERRRLQLLAGDVRVEFEEGTDISYVGALVRALRG
jgi:transposase-like protein